MNNGTGSSIADTKGEIKVIEEDKISGCDDMAVVMSSMIFIGNDRGKMEFPDNNATKFSKRFHQKESVTITVKGGKVKSKKATLKTKTVKKSTVKENIEDYDEKVEESKKSEVKKVKKVPVNEAEEKPKTVKKTKNVSGEDR